MRLFVTAILLVAAQAASLGSDHCTWGPSYWCSSVQTATACQAFQHCLSAVWGRQLLDVKQTAVCQRSQKLVGTARQVLSAKGGKDEATYLVASLCRAVDDAVVRQQCKDTISNHLPEVFKLIDTDMEALSVAAVLGLCEPFDDDDNATPTQGPNHPPTMCNDCRAFVSDLQTTLNQPGSEERFSAVVEDIVCSQLADLQPLCKAVVETALPKLYKFISENEHPETVCRLGLFCVDTLTKPKLDVIADATNEFFAEFMKTFELEAEDEVSCWQCHKALSSAFDPAKGSQLTNAVQKTIGFLCSQTHLSGEKCQVLSEGLIPKQLLALLTRDVDVRAVCTNTLQCSGEWPLSAGDQVVEELAQRPPVAVTPPTPADSCPACQRFFSDASDVIRNKVTAPEAAALIQTTLCEETGPLGVQCNALTNAAMPFILDMLASADSPSMVCSALTLCPKSATTPKFDLVKAFATSLEQRQVKDTFKCDECYAIVQDAQRADRNPDVQKGIVNFFNNICDQLGQTAQQCKALVQQYAPQLFEILASELDPGTLCDGLLNCTKAAVTSEVAHPAVTSQTILQRVPMALTHDLDRDSASQDSRGVLKKSKQNSSVFGNALDEKEKKEMKKDEKEEKVPTINETRRPVKKSKTNSAVFANLEKETQKVKVAESVECAVCKLAMESIDQVIASNATEVQIETGLDKLCDLLPGSVKAPCDQFIATYTPALIDLLLQELDPKLVCDELKVCNESSSQGGASDGHSVEVVEEAEVEVEVEEVEEVGESVECAVCRLAMETIDQVIASNATEVQIENGLEKLCDLLPSSVKAPCDQFIVNYTPALVGLLIQELDPKLICDELQLCNDTRGFAAPEQEEEVGVESEGATLGEVEVRAEEAAIRGELECQICQLVVSSVDVLIGENKTEEAVQQGLDDVCNALPAAIRSQCVSFVNEYSVSVVQLIVEELDPKDICIAVTLCPQAEEASESEAETAVESESEAVTNGESEVEAEGEAASVWCDVCEAVMTVLDQLIAENSTENEIRQALEKACTVLPTTITTECQTFVDAYTQTIVNLILQEMKPKMICTAVRLCAETTPVEVALPEVEKPLEAVETLEASGNVVECELCKLIISEINKMILENRTEANIIDAIEKVCDVVSGDVREECRSEVRNYGPAVLDLLQHLDDPSQVCQALTVCAAKGSNKSLKSSAPVGNEGEVCLICQTLANYAGEALKQQATLDEVETLLDDLCTVFPASQTKNCKDVVDQLTPQILQLLAEKVDPKAICQDIQLCPKDGAAQEQMLVGVDPCTFGPAYWCANQQNAQQCGMMEDCVETYGMKL